MENFLIYLLKSAGLLSVFFLFYFFLLRKDTSFATNRRFLLGGLLASAVLPAIYFTRSVFIEATASQFFYTEGNFPISEAIPVEPVISPLQILFLLYTMGVISMATRLILQLISLNRLLISSSKSRIDNSYVIETSRRIAPFSFLNYIVYNPALHSESDVRHIIKHEKVHVSQYHSADVILANLTLVYQWFNPFAWLYLKNLQQNLEYIADEEAVKEVSCKKEYQKALVKISVENFNLAITNNFYQSLIKKRIIMLNNPSRSTNTSWKAALILPVLLAFLFLFNVKTVAQIKEEDVTASENMADEEVAVTITEAVTREELAGFSSLFKKHNIQLEFKNVEYNEAGLLTSIRAEFLDQNDNNSGSFEQSSPNGIKGFTFYHKEPHGSGFRSGIASNPASINFAVVPGKVKESLVIVNRDTTEGEKPVYIVNGKVITASAMDTIDPASIDSINVLKGASATKIYGGSGKNGVVRVYTNKDSVRGNRSKTSTYYSNSPTSGNKRSISIASAKSNNADTTNTAATIIRYQYLEPYSISADSVDINAYQYGTRTSPGESIYIKTTQGKPLYVIDGKVMDSDFTSGSLDPEDIASIHVLKGESATKEYGKRGENGVILVATKDNTSKVNGTTPTFAKINSSTTEEGLKITRQQLKEQANLEVEFEEVKRNKNGLITRIRISGKRNGSQASATYEVEKGIPKIFIGVRDNSVIISSNPPKK